MNTRNLLLVVVVLSVLTFASQALDLGLCQFRMPDRRQLATCTWYNSPDYSCCSVDDSQSLKESWESATGTFTNGTMNAYIRKVLTSTIYASCVDKVHKFVCWHCAPSQTNFLELSLGSLKPNLRVCPDYCDSIYESCKNLPIEGGLLREKYSSGEDVCTQWLQPMIGGATVVYKESNVVTKCFNSASGARPVLFFTFILALVSIVFSL
jgi:hypothetical protein